MPLVFFVGQNPGKSRSKVKRALEGNRTGDFIQTMIKEHHLMNVYLTNICQDTKLTIQNIQEGAIALYNDVERMEPDVIVLMGNVAQENAILPPSYLHKDFAPGCRILHDKVIIHMPHPSYVIRFSRDDLKEQYRNLFRALYDGTQQGPRQ